MVKRPGLGATLATSVVFALLLLSSLSLQYSAEAKAKLSATADAEHRLWDIAMVVEGNEAFDLLAEAQAALSSHSWSCSSGASQAYQALGTFNGSMHSGNLTVSESLVPIVGSTSKDNLSMLAPFGGSIPESFDMTLHVQIHGSSNSSQVSLSRKEDHALNLPAHLEAAASLCDESVSRVTSALNSGVVSNCTIDAIAPLMTQASSQPMMAAASAGMGFNLAYSIDSLGSCTVGFTVQLDQAGIQGPGGNFTLRVEESGTATPGE